MKTRIDGVWAGLGWATAVWGLGACSLPAQETQGATKAQDVVQASVPGLKLFSGSVDGVGSDSWSTVQLPETFTSMVVVATPVYPVSGVPVVPRIQNASGSSFELKVDRMDEATAAVPPLTVHYVVVEEGVYTEAVHGIALEAVRMQSTRTDGSQSWIGEARTYANTYDHPVVLGQVLSYEDPSPSMFWSHGGYADVPPSRATIHVGKHVGEDPDSSRADETLGYLVAEAGTYELGGVAWEFGLGPNQVRGPDSPTAGYPTSNGGPALGAVVSQAAMNGKNGSWGVIRSFDSETLFVGVDEDQLLDQERTHTKEQLFYLMINACSDSSACAPPDPCADLAQGESCSGIGTCSASGVCEANLEILHSVGRTYKDVGNDGTWDFGYGSTFRIEYQDVDALSAHVTQRLTLEFDLSSIPANATIQSASLHTHQVAVNHGPEGFDVDFWLYPGDGTASYGDADLGESIVATHHVGPGSTQAPTFDLTGVLRALAEETQPFLGLNLRTATEGSGSHEEWVLSSDVSNSALPSPRLFVSLVLH